ncbi:MAG: phage tail protein [Aquincola sp.]|nr:phage tail protein [Aquincola sp.]
MHADQVELHIGGRAQAGWTQYDIDSSLLVAADGWSVLLATSELQLPAEVVPGAPVTVRVGGEVVLQGSLDELEHSVEKAGHLLRLQGRDGAGVLIDCSAPIFTTQELTLAQVITKIVRPLGVTRIRIDADTQLLRDRVSTEPGDSAWEMLRRAAEANGLWPWFEPDGTLVIGGPDYSTAPVARLALRRDGTGNVLALSERRSISERHSELTVLGQAHASGSTEGRHNVRAVLRDTGVSVYRPRVVVDHEATTTVVAQARGEKVISDARVNSYGLQLRLAGHRTDGGVLWSAGQRVHLVSEPHGLDAVFFVMARRFSLDRRNGQTTTLTLVEDGVWALYAHPSRRKHRRGKNSLPGRIIDVKEVG